jgi:hypothetical protein
MRSLLAITDGFLDRICTFILAFKGNSEVYFFEDGFIKHVLALDLQNKNLKIILKQIVCIQIISATQITYYS